MKQAKIVLAAAGLLGLIAVFLPYISAEGMSISYWDFHKFPSSATEGLLNGPKQVYVAMVCFAVPLAMGLWALAGRLTRVHGIVGAIFSLAAFAPQGVHKAFSSTEGVSTAFGAKLLFISAVLGLVASIVAIAKPETK